jgi:hypothetical protein
MTVTDALDAVLREAVARHDDALIEAYREIYQGIKQPKRRAGRHDALRLGILLGLKLRRTASALPHRINPGG